MKTNPSTVRKGTKGHLRKVITEYRCSPVSCDMGLHFSLYKKYMSSGNMYKRGKSMGNPRRGVPTGKQSDGLFFAPPAPFKQRDFAVCGPQGGALPLHPTAVLKRRAKTFGDFADVK